MINYLLKEVADAEGEAFPAESGGRDEVEGGLPVQGELEGNAVEAVLQAQLGTGTYIYIGLAFNGGEAYAGLGTGEEIEGAEGADLEIIGQTGTESVHAPAQVDFTEVVGTESVLVREFCTVTGADTDGAGLGGSHNGETQDGSHDKDEFFHI